MAKKGSDFCCQEDRQNPEREKLLVREMQGMRNGSPREKPSLAGGVL